MKKSVKKNKIDKNSIIFIAILVIIIGGLIIIFESTDILKLDEKPTPFLDDGGDDAGDANDDVSDDESDDAFPEEIRRARNIGNEIARIEMPGWVAQDEEMLKRVMSIIIDQCNKGNGYPVAVSESHEQAVVKGPEREFFFHMLTKMGITHNYRAAHSQKSLKKRFVSV